MAAENSNKSKLKMYTCTRKNAFTLVSCKVSTFEVWYQLRKCKLKIEKFRDVCMTGGIMHTPSHTNICKCYELKLLHVLKWYFRIVLCAMCGDPYPVELILGPLLHHQNCWRSSTRPDTIILETYLGFDKRRVQITLTSYHSKSETFCEK